LWRRFRETFPPQEISASGRGRFHAPGIAACRPSANLPNAVGAFDSWLPCCNASDILARPIAQSLSERLGQQFVVENRPGAGGKVGTEVVVRALPDGYTLLLVLSGNAYSATLYADLNFNFIRDIAPVASIVDAPYAMVVNPSVPAKTVSGRP
jgi:hypothetical protein